MMRAKLFGMLVILSEEEKRKSRARSYILSPPQKSAYHQVHISASSCGVGLSKFVHSGISTVVVLRGHRPSLASVVPSSTFLGIGYVLCLSFDVLGRIDERMWQCLICFEVSHRIDVFPFSVLGQCVPLSPPVSRHQIEPPPPPFNTPAVNNVSLRFSPFHPQIPRTQSVQDIFTSN
ncbi:hypothetical protein AAHA92_13943 [Salvia divinorum]|uniref:Uncharacterized protein n=1 Tax=Salvia divinorum TaxID=28513 RepID=A0ABD1H9Y0_SALDI